LADEIPVERLSAQLAWIGVEDVPIVFVNQVIAQIDERGEIIIAFGQATPPVILGSPEEQRQQIANVPFVQVRPVSRITLSRSRLEEVVDVLQKTLDNQARVLKQLSEGGSK
jgi:hypothetical protein